MPFAFIGLCRYRQSSLPLPKIAINSIEIKDIGGIAQLVERLVRKKLRRLWTQKVLRGQSGTKSLQLIRVYVEAAPTAQDLNGPNFRRRYRLGYRRTLLARLSSAGAVPSNKRFQNDDVLSVGE